jgi:hypothetical protein
LFVRSHLAIDRVLGATRTARPPPRFGTAPAIHLSRGGMDRHVIIVAPPDSPRRRDRGETCERPTLRALAATAENPWSPAQLFHESGIMHAARLGGAMLPPQGASVSGPLAWPSLRTAAATPLVPASGRHISDNDEAFLGTPGLIGQARESPEPASYVGAEDDHSSRLSQAPIEAATRGVRGSDARRAHQIDRDRRPRRCEHPGAPLHEGVPGAHRAAAGACRAAQRRCDDLRQPI